LDQAGLGNHQAVAFDFTVNANAGDFIDFTVGAWNEVWTHSRLYSLDATVAAVPEPASMLALAGGFALILRRRKK
jgi:hypothetical protein